MCARREACATDRDNDAARTPFIRGGLWAAGNGRVLTGFLAIFREAGLGAATVQRLEVTHEQISTLFWINVTVGAVLATFTAILAPAVVAFYGEPRLYWITVVRG